MPQGKKCVVGVPNEIKTHESRVAMIPVGVEELTRGRAQGAHPGRRRPGQRHQRRAVPRARRRDRRHAPTDVWSNADLIVKVKEPLPVEWPLMRPGQVVFTYFHFAADEELTRAVMESGHHGRRLRDDQGRQGHAAAADADERGGRPHEHPGGGEVPGTAVRGPRHPARRRAGRAAGQRRHPRRRRRRRQRRQGRRRPRRQRHHPRRQPRPAALPRRRDAAQRDHAVQRPAQHPRQPSAGPTCSSAPC